MDYKKIIKSRKLRQNILNLLSFVPDKQMVELQYLIKTGRKLNLANPRRFTEKLQWYKLNYKNEQMPYCVNKYRVRGYVERHGLQSILNEMYGVYDDPKDIQFDKLPNQFVLKDTLGGGSTSVIVVKDMAEFDIHEACAVMKKWVASNPETRSGGREWPYLHQKHQIIVEKYLEQKDGDLIDYKFFCFDGKVQYLYVRDGYAKAHDAGKMAFFDGNLRYLANVGMDYCNIAEKEPAIDKDCIRKMIYIADKLSANFPHVRVDLYDVNGQIIFGELTFFNASGYMNFIPDSFDFEMGERFVLPEIAGGGALNPVSFLTLDCGLQPLIGGV